MESEKEKDAENAEKIEDTEDAEKTEDTEDAEDAEKETDAEKTEDAKLIKEPEILLESYTPYHFIKFFFLQTTLATIMCTLLAYPTLPILYAGPNLVFITLWAYWVHRILHLLPDIPLNYHVHIHHDKYIKLPRHTELFFEFLTNLSWFLPLLLLVYVFKLQCLSPILIVFIGLWYSSIHVLNLSLGNTIEHKIHHTELNYNYGPSVMDYIFGTLKVDSTYNTHYEILNGIFFFFLLKASSIFITS
jgi:hypothetical protein